MKYRIESDKNIFYELDKNSVKLRLQQLDNKFNLNGKLWRQLEIQIRGQLYLQFVWQLERQLILQLKMIYEI